MENYIRMLIREMDLWKEKLDAYFIRSVFIGGGTPSVVPLHLMEKLFNQLHAAFHILPSCEISIESNPGTLDEEKLRTYIHFGVNRLSIGLQAWQDHILKQLGRIHKQAQFLQSYELARKAGFENVNVDLMFGLPGQRFSDWKETLFEVVRLHPEHISAYGLTIEDDTLFGKWYRKGLLALPSEEEERRMYHFAIDYLVRNGYQHYEISNFSVRGKECLHNRNYWENGEYIGLGLAAHSYFQGVRFSNTEVFETYFMDIRQNRLPIVHRQENTLQDEISETLFLGLRLIQGINRAKFRERFGFDPVQKYAEKIKKLEGQKLLEIDPYTIRLTRKGLDVSNQVFIEFLPD